MTSQVIFQSIDYRNAKPVAEAVFRIYKELYSYDRTPLGAKLESVDDSSLHWRRERISSPVRASGKCQRKLRNLGGGFGRVRPARRARRCHSDVHRSGQLLTYGNPFQSIEGVRIFAN